MVWSCPFGFTLNWKWKSGFWKIALNLQKQCFKRTSMSNIVCCFILVTLNSKKYHFSHKNQTVFETTRYPLKIVKDEKSKPEQRQKPIVTKKRYVFDMVGLHGMLFLSFHCEIKRSVLLCSVIKLTNWIHHQEKLVKNCQSRRHNIPPRQCETTCWVTP